jgi:hypothetical protein
MYSHSIGKEKQLEIFICHGIITDSKHHMLCTNCYNTDSSQLIISSKNVDIKPIEYDKLLEKSMAYAKEKLLNDKKQKNTQHSRIALSQISNDECLTLCGLSINNINEIAQIISYEEQNVFEFFTICRQSLSHRIAAVIFGFKSHSTITSHFNTILELLTQKFVPQHIGSTAFTRNNIKENIPILFKELFPDVIGILDGTYLFILPKIAMF